MADIKDRLDILDDDTLAIVSEVATDDLRALADHCAAIRSTGQNKIIGKDMSHVASVPVWLVKAFCNNKGITWAQFMRNGEFDEEFLNMPETKAFRTWEGRI